MTAQEQLTKEIASSGLSILPLGGQGELGQVLWVISYGEEMLIIDAGASYPTRELPGVDLLMPNTSFLEANEKRILALLLTNGSEEYIGAVPYLLKHVKVPKIMAPKFVSSLLDQVKFESEDDHVLSNVKIETVKVRHQYQIGPFIVEWLRVNDAVTEACALYISTKAGDLIYATGFKFDQTPVDGELADIGYLSQLGDDGITLLIAASAGVERSGYSQSEMFLFQYLEQKIFDANGRVIVLMPGTNTYRFQNLLHIAKQCNRKLLVLGDTLMHSAVAATMTGNLICYPELEVNIEEVDKLSDQEVLVIATGKDGNPMPLLSKLVNGLSEDLHLKEGDTIIFSADIPAGRSRQMAMLLDQLLLLGVKVYWGEEGGVHVSRYAGQEELKLMLSLIRPAYFIPAFGEGRHIMHHAKLAREWGMPESSIFPLQNGHILSFDKGLPKISGRAEHQAVYVNKDQGDRVTTFTVNERLAMSAEGVITISLIAKSNGHLVSGPRFDCGAASFRHSVEWKEACAEIKQNIIEAVVKKEDELNNQTWENNEIAIRALVRDIAFKTLRARLQTKPVLQIVVQQLITKRPQ